METVVGPNKPAINAALCTPVGGNKRLLFNTNMARSTEPLFLCGFRLYYPIQKAATRGNSRVCSPH
jgi:hypothetical protein